MNITIWISPAGDDPFSHRAVVEDESGFPDALAAAFSAFHVARPGQTLFSVPIRIEQHA